MDESGSVGYSNYQLMKQFVYNTVNEFDIGSDETQVGVISYSTYATAHFYLNTYHDKSTLLTAINNLPFNSGGTNAADALNLLRQSGFTSANGGRPLTQAIPRVAIVITDAYSNDYYATVTAAQSAHDEGITIFAVGIGNYVDDDELAAIASDPSYVSDITGFDTSQFDALQTTIINEACTTSAEVEINETVNTSVGEGETSFIEIPYDSDEGVTIKVNVLHGAITVYVSDHTTTPNEAFYDWMIETDGYSDIFLNPDDISRIILRDTVHVAIEGEDVDNYFTLVSEEGDTTEPLGVPVNVTIGTLTATSVSISWTEPSSRNAANIIRYDLELTEERFGLPTLKTNTTGTLVTVTGLEEYNTYACKVVAVSRSKVGMFSFPVIFATLEAAPSAAPQDPSGTALSPTAITLEWDPPPAMDINGDIEYYVVEVVEVYTGRMWTFHAVDVHINIGALHAYYVYRCRIAAFTIQLGPFTDYYDVYSGEKAPTAAPENLTVVGNSPSSVDLAWDAPPYEMQNGCIRYYNVEITKDETGNVLEFTTNYTNITINDLVPFYNYTCTVFAETIANGPSSDEITFVLPEGAPDGAPRNVTGLAISSTSIEFSWDPPARSLQNGYMVEYRVRVTETDTGTVSTMNVTDTSLTLSSLHPYYVYSFSVAAIGLGPYSTAIYTTTDEDVPNGAPQNFTSVATSPFKADLSWMPPLVDKENGVITNYVINITEDDTGETFHQATASSTSLTTDDLRPYYTYTCVIAAETSVGVGPFSSNVSFTTLEYVPSEPKHLQLDVINETAMSLSWTTPDSPNGVILEYQVIFNGYKPMLTSVMIEITDGPNIINVSAKAGENPVYTLVINDLVAGLIYKIKLRARTSVGYGVNITVTTTQSSAVTKQDVQSSCDGATAAIVVLAILGTIGWGIVAIFVVYFLRHHFTKQKKYGLGESTVEVYTNSRANPQIELQSSANDYTSMPTHEEDNDIDDKPPSNQDKSLKSEQ